MGGGSTPKAQVYEPVKSAEETIKETSSEVSRAQQLRRGITSTFSRSTMGSTGASAATGGSSAKLGA